MSPLLVALLGMLLVPFFVATWRTSLLVLSGQGLLMALIAYRLDPDPATPAEWLVLADLALVRGCVAPFALYGVLQARNTPPRDDRTAPTLLSWALALGIVLASFSLAELLLPDAGDARTLVAVAGAGVLLGFLVLATQAGAFSQMVGALRIENAIALLELGGGRHHLAVGVQLGLIGVFLATVAAFRGYLATLGPVSAAGSAAHSGKEGPTL